MGSWVQAPGANIVVRPWACRFGPWGNNNDSCTWFDSKGKKQKAAKERSNRKKEQKQQKQRKQKHQTQEEAKAAKARGSKSSRSKSKSRTQNKKLIVIKYVGS